MAAQMIPAQRIGVVWVRRTRGSLSAGVPGARARVCVRER